MERRFVPTGIKGLDEVLGGGFLEGSIVTLSGPTGAGKSTFGMQFLFNGASIYDEPGMYIAIEESRNDLLFHMSGYAWNLKALEQERKFILIDYPVHEVDQIVSAHEAIGEIINSAGIKRVVIDSVMPIALHFPNMDERRRGFLKLIENIRHWEATTLILAENSDNEGDRPQTDYDIETFTDGWLNLLYRHDQKKNERIRMIEIMKLKGVGHSSKSYEVKIDKDGMSILSDKKEDEIKAPIPNVQTELLKKELLEMAQRNNDEKELLKIKKFVNSFSLHFCDSLPSNFYVSEDMI
jgi:KaiC/GvpD/RAD55 family RecA-like ATPase